MDEKVETWVYDFADLVAHKTMALVRNLRLGQHSRLVIEEAVREAVLSALAEKAPPD